MTELVNLLIDGSIICHAWNKEKNQIAVSANSKDVLIYSKEANGKWVLIHTLIEHTSKVLSIDWAPNSNRLLSCGADKNAYVWSFDGKNWKPELVILRINRAATCCRWSPSETKFAIGCGSRCICVCYFEKKQEFWVADKHIRKPIKSSVLCLDWHPNSILLAVGGTDYKCRVYSTHIEVVDGPKPTSTQWGNSLSYGECLIEYGTQSNGWVYSISFNPTGNRLAWVGHDSCIYLVDAEKDVKQLITYKSPFLPFLSIKFITNLTLAAAGHDCYPILFTINDNKLSVLEKLNVGQNLTKSSNARNMFQNKDRLQSETAASSDQNTIHQNSIKQVSVYSTGRQGVDKISTCGLDGLIVIWDFQGLESQFSGLKIK